MLRYRFSNKQLQTLSKCVQRNAKIVGTMSSHSRVGHPCDGKRERSLSNLLSRLGQSVGQRAAEEIKIFAEDDTGLGNALRALQMVERIRGLFSGLGFDFTCEDEFGFSTCNEYAQNLMKWVTLYNENKAEEVAKYQSVSRFNRLEKQEPLPALKYPLPFNWHSGEISCTTRQYLFSKRLDHTWNGFGEEKRFSLGQQFLYFKKGCPVVCDDFKRSALEKHEKALTQTEPKRMPQISHDDDYWFEYFIRENKLKRCSETEVKERVRDICKDVFKSYKDPTYWWNPSVNASYETSRDKGGAASEINLSTSWDDFEFVEIQGKNSFREFIKVPKVSINLDLTSRIDCRPVALPEPLKCRVITAESAWASYALKGAQSELWRCLKQFPWFVLTGKPCTSSDIPELSKGESWISVDYSAATDNLSSWFTRYVLKVIALQTGLPFGLMYESLCQHRINYGTKKVPRLEEQKTGQLMGSILSFIVLCLCNATVLSLTVDPYLYNRKTSILINGDDGLFKGDLNTFSRWSFISSSLGLSPSVGKTYVSDKFCVINSQLYYRSKDSLVKFSRFSNMSALTSYDSKAGAELKIPDQMAASYDDWMAGFDALDQKTAVEAENLWYHSMYDFLSKGEVADKSVAWYAPKCFSGLGIRLPKSGKGNDKVLNYVQRWRAFKAIRDKKRINPVYPVLYRAQEGVINNQTSDSDEINYLHSAYNPSFYNHVTEDICRDFGLDITKIQLKPQPTQFVSLLDRIEARQNLKSSPISAIAEAALSQKTISEVLQLRKKEKLISNLRVPSWFDKHRIVRVVDLQWLSTEDGTSGPQWKPKIPNYNQDIEMPNYTSWLHDIVSQRTQLETPVQESIPLTGQLFGDEEELLASLGGMYWG